MKKDAIAEKWKEILQSQKDALIFIKWSADDEVNLSKLASEPNHFSRHSTGEASADYIETGK